MSREPQDIAVLNGRIDQVNAMTETFIKERTIPSAGSAGGIAAGSKGSAQTGKVDVDDAVLFLARFRKGAVASFEASRLATGYKNRNGFEIHGEKGALRFNFEDMNYLDFYDNTEDPKTAAWRHIIVTSGGNHPYVGAWWPPGHIIGYEHTFVHAMADFLNAIASGEMIRPNFEDGVKTMEILEAALASAAAGCRINIGK